MRTINELTEPQQQAIYQATVRAAKQILHELRYTEHDELGAHECHEIASGIENALFRHIFGNRPEYSAQPPTRENLIDAGYIKDGSIWISPLTGECLSFEQARAEWKQDALKAIAGEE